MVPPAHSCFAGWPVAIRRLCVVAAAWLLWNPDLSADERLSSVIRNVEDNEGLYQNLDARIRTHYDIGDRSPMKFEWGNERRNYLPIRWLLWDLKRSAEILPVVGMT